MNEPSFETPALNHEPQTGRFLPGNRAALKHGLHAFKTRGELPADLVAEMVEFRQAVEADQGGADQLSAIAAGYVRRLTELETIAQLLAGDLAARGLFTARGRMRSTYAAFLQTLDRWDRYAKTLGLERKSKQARPGSPSEWLASRGDEGKEHAS